MAFTLASAAPASTRAAVCQGALIVTRHRLEDICIDAFPLEGDWPADARWAGEELQRRCRPRRNWLRRKAAEPSEQVDLNPKSSGDFDIALLTAPHTWITCIADDQSFAMDTENLVRLWLTQEEHAQLRDHLMAAGVDTNDLVRDPELQTWSS